MTGQVTITRPSGGLPAVIKLLLVPSWVVGLGAVLMGIDVISHMVPGSIAPIIGSTVLVGGFLVAPLATLLAVGLAAWHSLRNRHQTARTAGRRGVGVWTLIGLSFLCLVSALVATASLFQS
jgi:hypothetical protein